jgi:hypothetical protein
MAIIKTNIALHPIAGQGIGGQTTHHSIWPVSLAGAIASGDTAEVARLPVQARVIGMTVKNATGVSQTFSLGIAGTPALFRASAALANGVSATGVADAGMFYRVQDGAYPYLSVNATFGAAAAASDGVLWISIAYAVDEPTAPAGSTL